MIDRPIFVVGTGRSGLSPLLDLVAYHPEFAWPSNYHNKIKNPKTAAYFSRFVELPLISGQIKYIRFMPAHAETYELWDRCYYGFRRPFRDLRKDDVTPHIINKFTQTMKDILEGHGKKRIIVEYSGWSRITFLKEIFPTAKFIHIIRDGRAVANSLTNVGFWHGWEGTSKWRWGDPGDELLEKLEKYGNSFIALAAVQWKMLVSNIQTTGCQLPSDDFMLIKYEDMVEDPLEVAAKCVKFCQVDGENQKFLNHLKTVTIVNANTSSYRIPAWKENYSTEQISMLDDLIGQDLCYFGYS